MIDLLGGAPAVEISPVAGREGTKEKWKGNK